MRIGYDISKALPPRDGIGNFTFELLRALLPILPHDTELLLYSPLQAIDGEGLIASLEALPGQLSWRGRTPQLCDRLDLFHSTSWCFPQLVRCPVLFTCYDLTFITHPQCHTLDNKLHCSRGLLEAIVGGAQVLAISEHTADDLRRLFELPLDRLEVIYPAAAAHFRRLDTAAVHHRLARDFDLRGGYLLAVGTVEPRKNLLRLLQAYGALPEAARQRAPLVLAGGAGWQEEGPLEDLLRRPELAGVRRLGRVDDGALVDLYNGATAFLYPSLAEGFGLPLLEAMACGAPVLTSLSSPSPRLNATAEVAGDAALLVDPLDVGAITAGLERLLHDDALRQRLRQAGEARLKHFSWQKSARAAGNLYHRLVSAA